MEIEEGEPGKTPTVTPPKSPPLVHIHADEIERQSHPYARQVGWHVGSCSCFTGCIERRWGSDR
ncbi:MAG: hypothetical protein IMY76_01190 [Chloroflexi bacterium]|nr:hypothetical protein [Chloroflexota bacterium]